MAGKVKVDGRTIRRANTEELAIKLVLAAGGTREQAVDLYEQKRLKSLKDVARKGKRLNKKSSFGTLPFTPPDFSELTVDQLQKISDMVKAAQIEAKEKALQLAKDEKAWAEKTIKRLEALKF